MKKNNIKTSSVLVLSSCLATMLCGLGVYTFFYAGLLPYLEYLTGKRSAVSFDFNREVMIKCGVQIMVLFLAAILLAIFANIANRNEKHVSKTEKD